MLGKKGQAETMGLEELVKLVIGLLLFMLLVAFLVFMFKSITTKAPSSYESDFKRLVSDINSYSLKSSEITTPIFTKDIIFKSFKNKNTPISNCGNNKNCLCYRKGSEKETEFKCQELNLKESMEIVDNNLIRPNDNKLTIYKELNVIKFK